MKKINKRKTVAKKKKMNPKIHDAVIDYLKAISVDYGSREGDDSVRGPFKKKIISLFRKLPAREKLLHLYLILKNMSESSVQSRFTNWRRKLAIELVEELEKI
jgi:hypothetical protein